MNVHIVLLLILVCLLVMILYQLLNNVLMIHLGDEPRSLHFLCTSYTIACVECVNRDVLCLMQNNILLLDSREQRNGR